MFKDRKKLVAQRRKNAKKKTTAKEITFAPLRERSFKTKSAAPSKLKAAQSVFL
jgi:hypothetical protein